MIVETTACQSWRVVWDTVYSLVIVSAHTDCVQWCRVYNVETSYFTQLKMRYLMTTFRCPSDILITSWLFTAWWSTWPGNYLVPCVAELVGSCIPIHARRCLSDPKCLFYPSGLSLCLSVDHFCLVPVDDMVLFYSYTAWSVLHCSPLPWRLRSVYLLWKSPLLSCVPWSSDRTSCLSLHHKSWSSSCKGHDRSIRSSLHPWPCPSDEPQSSVVFGEDG